MLGNFSVLDVKSVYCSLSYTEMKNLDICTHRDLIVSLTNLPSFSFVIFSMLNISPERKYQALSHALETLRRKNVLHAVRVRNGDFIRFSPAAMREATSILENAESQLHRVLAPNPRGSGSSLRHEATCINPVMQVIRELGPDQALQRFPCVMNSIQQTANYLSGYAEGACFKTANSMASGEHKDNITGPTFIFGDDLGQEGFNISEEKAEAATTIRRS